MNIGSTTTWAAETVADQTSTDAYADVLLRTDSDQYAQKPHFRAITSGPISFEIKNTGGSNAITVQILGTSQIEFVDADWAVVAAGASLAAGAKQNTVVDVAHYLYYKVQIKATTPASQSTAKVFILQKRV